jgi:hypothetical protein
MGHQSDKIAANLSDEVAATESTEVVVNLSDEVAATESDEVAANLSDEVAATESDEVAATEINEVWRLPRGLEAGLRISDLALAGVQDAAQCPERGHVIVQAGLASDGRFEEEPQESVDTQGFCTGAPELVWIFVRLALHVEDAVELLGLGTGALRELPGLVPQKLLDGLPGNTEGAGLRKQSFDLFVQDAALQQGVHPIVGRDRDRIHLLPVCAAARTVRCG